MDPTKIQVAEFWKVRGCPLGAALRRRFKHEKTFPAKKFKCVFSEEVLPNRGLNKGVDDSLSNSSLKGENNVKVDGVESTQQVPQVRANGSISHITAVFGFNIAALVIQDIYSKTVLD
jgi:tRNA A37 threonylcarbamoyladenosine dehydratase